MATADALAITPHTLARRATIGAATRGAGERRADGVLHRHDNLYRLQGLRGRVQGMEPAPGAGRRRSGSRDERRELRQHAWPERDDVAARQVHRAVRRAVRRALAHDERCLQALRPGALSRGLSNRRDRANGVRHGRHPVGHVQWVPRLYRGLSVRGDRHQPGVAHGAEMHAVQRSPGGRARAGVLEGLPHRFDSVRSDLGAAEARATRDSRSSAPPEKRGPASTAPTRMAHSAASTRSTCWSMSPKCTVCRASPSCPPGISCAARSGRRSEPSS